MDTQVILGLLPGALADPGARTMVVGLGSGFTLSAALAAGVGPTEVVELEPGVVEASHFFHGPGHDPLDDPRVTLVLDDARTRLAHSGGKYGAIISEPSNPWIAGVNSLFTVDFYRLVKAHLDPDGVFCQWLQLYELTPQTFATLAHSFVEVFPEGSLFALSGNADAILIAAPHGRRLALDRLRQPAVLATLARAQLGAPEGLAANYAAPLSALAALADGAPFNPDDRPVVEYRAPRDVIEVMRSGVLSQLELPQTMPDGGLFADWPAERWFGIRARAFLASGDEQRASAVVRAARAAGVTGLADHLGDEIETRRREGGTSPVEAATKLMLAGDAPRARGLRAGRRRRPDEQRRLALAGRLPPVDGRSRRSRGGALPGAQKHRLFDSRPGGDGCRHHCVEPPAPARRGGALRRGAAPRSQELEGRRPRGERAVRDPGPRRRRPRPSPRPGRPPRRRRDDGNAVPAGRRAVAGGRSPQRSRNDCLASWR